MKLRAFSVCVTGREAPFCLALSALVLFFSPTAPAAEKPFHVCFFSLNNEKEFQEARRFAEKLNRHSPRKIVVTEYRDPLENIDTPTSFQRLVESGTECDGLVISGHHTGTWGGKRAKESSLSLDFLENLACDPKHKAWFERIHALWLQGCRTLGVGEIRAEERDSDAVSADFHTQRVGNVLQEDHLAQGFQDLNMEFSATLDQDNPLSSRYLRVFPRSTVFGWTRTAPGEKSRSEYSFLYHMAHIARRISKEDKFPEDPVKENLSPKSLNEYLVAIQLALDGLEGRRGECEDLLVGGWLDHGNVQKTKKFAFNNPDLNAYKALQRNPNPAFEEAKRLDCLFRKAKDRETLLQALDTALQDQRLIGLSFNSIFEALQRLKKDGDEPLLQAVREKLRGSAALQAFLSEKLLSRQLGVLRKIDYYAFHREMQGKGSEKVETEIRRAALAQLLVPLRGHDDYDRQDYKSTLMDSLRKHNLLTREFLLAILNSPKLSMFELNEVARSVNNSISYFSLSVPEITLLIRKIVDSPKSSAPTLSIAARAIELVLTITNQPLPEASELLRKIVHSPRADYFTLGAVARAIGMSEQPISEASELLRKIVDSPKAFNQTLASVAYALESKQQIPEAFELLRKIVDSPVVHSPNSSDEAPALEAVVYVIRYGKLSTPKASELLWKIVDSPNVSRLTLGNATLAIKERNPPFPDAESLLQRIEARQKQFLR